MKRYFYIILTSFCELLSFSSVWNHSDHSVDLLRILYLEKSALHEFSFNPFPLFVMLCCQVKTILEIIFITSNIPKAELIISRFKSRQIHFAYLIGKQVKNTLFCSLVTIIIPVILTALLYGFSDITHLVFPCFFKQFLVLYLASGTSLILRERVNSGASDILGAMIVIVLIMIDIFTDVPMALIDLSRQNLLTIVCEVGVCLGITLVCYMLYSYKKEVI